VNIIIKNDLLGRLMSDKVILVIGGESCFGFDAALNMA
jgi:hypothetical protein